MKTRQLNLRVSEEEVSRWKAQAGGQPLASWVRQTLDAASTTRVPDVEIPQAPLRTSKSRATQSRPAPASPRKKQYRTDF